MKILFLCAHPDDLEFSVPGMMITLGNNIRYLSSSELSSKYSKKIINKKKRTRIIKAIQKGKSFFLKNSNNENQELRVKIACMTRGEMSEFTDRIHSTVKAAKIRTQELNGSQKILTGGEPDYLGFFDGYIRVSGNTIETVKKYILNVQPDIIIAPEPVFAWYHHVDHKRTGKIAYYALMRLVKEKSVKSPGKIPKLFYFQSIRSDWYFPRYTEFKSIIEVALRNHRSQAALLFVARLPGYFEKIIHGLKVRNSIYGESLRFQPVSDKLGKDNKKNKKYKTKKFENLPLWKRIVYFLSYNLINNAGFDYSNRYCNFDGKLPID